MKSAQVCDVAAMLYVFALGLQVTFDLYLLLVIENLIHLQGTSFDLFHLTCLLNCTHLVQNLVALQHVCGYKYA